MSDIKLSFDSTTNEYDVSFVNGDLAHDDGLETAVTLSLFTDRRATTQEAKPNDLRGWWADETLIDGDKIGSLLWTLKRASLTNENLQKLKTHVEDALQWMITDGVAQSVVATVTRLSTYSCTIEIKITKPDNVLYKYKFAWQSMGA